MIGQCASYAREVGQASTAAQGFLLSGTFQGLGLFAVDGAIGTNPGIGTLSQGAYTPLAGTPSGSLASLFPV